MPYTIRKQKCKQADGDSGSYTLSYTDKKGKKHTICHTSREKAQGQIAAIEMPRETDESDDMPILERRAHRITRRQLRNIIREELCRVMS